LFVDSTILYEFPRNKLGGNLKNDESADRPDGGDQSVCDGGGEGGIGINPHSPPSEWG
jgi:hypothetical protein